MEKVVNGFWYGSELGELEKLCIDSWIENGYKFRLWLYEDIEVPKDVIVKNANHIVSFDQYFTYSEGHTVGTPVAFSNLFRTQLLYKLGGLYVDLDVLCLKPYEFNERFVFSEQVDSGWDYHVATCILYSENKGERIFEDWSDWILAKKNKTITHGDLGPNLFTKLIINNKLQKYVLPKDYFCPIDWQSYKDMFINRPDSYGIHLFGSIWEDEDYKNIDKLR
jgi:mannosyltransferase OCH1-like enzyme